MNENTTAVEIKDVLWEYASAEGKGHVLWPMRYALTGRDKSPDPFVVASILGKDTTLRRLEKAIATLETIPI
jgi:glutamyl/glutaminyl-tRNA synthetase